MKIRLTIGFILLVNGAIQTALHADQWCFDDDGMAIRKFVEGYFWRLDFDGYLFCRPKYLVLILYFLFKFSIISFNYLSAIFRVLNLIRSFIEWFDHFGFIVATI